jgi:hypothetical protein
MKALIFDSGPLINLAMNGLLYLIEDLKKSFNGVFLVTRAVKYETVDRPLHVDRFEFEAMEVQALIDKGTLQLPSSVGINEKELELYTEEIMDLANHFIQVKGKWITLVSAGEMSCLALSDMLEKKGYETMIAIDERTTRVMGENPEELEQLMSHKIHQRAELVAKDINVFRKYKFIRSPEIAYVAYKKGLLHDLPSNKKALEAVLYATKYKGSAISFEEIDQIKKL